jgi:hypothetical protein
MRRIPVVIAISLLALATASPALGSAIYLTSNSGAGACGGDVSCFVQDSKTLNPATPASTLSSSISSTLGDGSYANASAISSFGSLHVYADAYRTLTGPIGDAQSKGYAEFYDIIPAANIIGGSYNFTFAIAGSHTPTAGGSSVSAYAFLSYDLVDLSTNADLGSGTWMSTDLVPTTTINRNISVPLGDGIAMLVSFEADAYTMNYPVTYPVVVDYSHTLNVYIDPASSGANVVGLSGHSYASPVVGAVPEPSTWPMLLTGFGMLGLAIRGRRKRVAAAA